MIVKHAGDLRFSFEVIRDNSIKEGIIHFFDYDEHNQLQEVLSTAVYMDEATFQELLYKIREVFSSGEYQNFHLN